VKTRKYTEPLDRHMDSPMACHGSFDGFTERLDLVLLDPTKKLDSQMDG
jgi:hypothetical protein